MRQTVVLPTPTGDAEIMARINEVVAEGVTAFLAIANARVPEGAARGVPGLRAWYRLTSARWVRPEALTLAEMRRMLARLTRAGDEDEAARLCAYGRQKFGPDVILTRADALAMMARALKVPVTALLE